MQLPVFLGRFYEDKIPVDPNFEAKVIHAGQTLGLKSLPKVWFSTCQKRYTSPTVFGRWGIRPTLVLPKDFEDAITEAAGGDENLAERLTSFTILHELSHIKNSDYQFMSWITTLTHTSGWWIALFSVVMGSYLIFTGNIATMKIALTCLWPLLCLFLLFWVTYNLISRHREYLADARASACMLPEDWQKLFQRSSEGLSPIEQLFIYFSMRRSLIGGQKIGAFACLCERTIKCISNTIKRISVCFCMHLSLLSRLREQLAKTLQTHPSPLQRNNALTNGRFLGVICPCF